MRLRSLSLAALVSFVLLSALPGCPSSKPTCPGMDCPPPDAGLPARVCANLRKIQCEEGDRPTCQQSIERAINLHYPVACWETAATKEAGRGCGQLKCP
jgi:hypothetical protein